MNINTSLDNFQIKAVTSDNKNLLVVAAPGSGKTSVIINRAVHLVKNKGVNLESIIVITFTKNAAINMKRRYLNITGEKNTPFIGTFHSLFYKIIENHCGDIRIISHYEAFIVIKNTLNRFADNLTEDKINEFLNYIPIYKIHGEKLNKGNIDLGIFKKCYEDYEDYKRKNNLNDFDDLQIKVYKLLSENELVLTKYSTLYKYILIDEFQDCDEMQIKILQLLNKHSSIFAVGDEDQCIYSFRGSKPECMVDFEKYFPKSIKTFLGINYRSTIDIVLTSMKLIKNNRMRNNKAVEASSKRNSKINIINCCDNKDQCMHIIYEINNFVTSNVNNINKMAILYRTNAENRLLVDLLIKNKINFQLLDSNYSFYDNMICKDFIAYLKLAIDFTDVENFITIINKPYRYIGKMNLEKLRHNKYKNDCFEFICSLDIPNFQVKALKKVRKILNRASKQSTKNAVSDILYELDYYKYIQEYCIKNKRELSDFDYIINEFIESCSDYKNINDFINHTIEAKKILKNCNNSNIILSTIHGVKGMEFNSVLIMDCIEGYLPHERSIDYNLEEERRVFFVAITRAIENLFLYVPKILNGNEKIISRFIKECELHVVEDIESMLHINQIVRHNNFGNGIVKSIFREKIEIQFANEVIRQFDLRVLLKNKLLK